MKTLRTDKWVATAVALAWLTVTNVALAQATITRVPDLGGGTMGMEVRALNNSGAVAGYSRDTNNNERAFLFSNGILRNLGTLGGPFSAAAGLSDNGLVTGYALLPEDEFGFFPQHAFLYNGTSMIDLGVLPGGSYSEGQFVNANGHVAGAADADGSFGAAFVYRNGHMTNIGSFGSGMSFLLDQNATGQVVGYSVDDTFLVARAFFYDTNLVDLGTLGGVFSSAWAINDAGVIVGDADRADNMTRAFVYQNGVMTDLGTLGGDFSWAIDINNAGQILGYSEYEPGNSAYHAFVIGTNGVMTDLGTLGGTISDPAAMNSHGHVIGLTYGDPLNSQEIPFLYRNGTMVDLNSLLPPNSGWVILRAFHINDSGQISGHGLHNGEFAYYILTLGNENTPPVAEAGNDQIVECGSLTHLDGSASTDADNDALTYEWRNGATVLGTSAVLDVALARGAYTLTLVVTDPSGASDDDTVSITVSDTTAPSVICPANQSVPVGADCQALVPDFASAALATDACSSVLTRSQTPAAGTPVSVGTHTVTVSVTDEVGNVGTCTVTLAVIDNIAPAGDCPPAQTVNADSDCTAAVPDFTAALLATDNCTPAEALVKTQSPAAGTRLPAGSHVINLTVTDAAGNSSACTTVLTIVSINNEPMVTCPAGVTAEVEADGKAAVPDFASAATVVESCHGPSTRSQTPAAGTRLGVGVHTVTVQAVDPAGNVGTCTTTFTVVDRTAPVITSISVDPSLLTEDDTMVPVTVSVTVTDNVDPNPQVRIVSIESNEPVTGRGDNTSPDWVVTGALTAQVRSERMHVDARIYTITVRATDASGNSSEAITNVTVLKKNRGNSGPGRKIDAASSITTKKSTAASTTVKKPAKRKKK